MDNIKPHDDEIARKTLQNQTELEVINKSKSDRPLLTDYTICHKSVYVVCVYVRSLT